MTLFKTLNSYYLVKTLPIKFGSTTMGQQVSKRKRSQVLPTITDGYLDTALTVYFLDSEPFFTITHDH